MVSTSELLGRGLYSPQEAAVYTRTRPQTVNRWLFGDGRGDSAIVPEVASGDQRVVTFLDFVQLLAVRDIRIRHKVPLSKIRDAVNLAQTRGIKYPFAMQHKTYLFGDMSAKGHGEVVLDIDGTLLQASGKAKGNLVMREIAELYMQDLFFDAESKLAAIYYPFGTVLDKSISMNPKIRFGEPMVESCGYPAEALFDAYQIEGSIDAAASAFGVTATDIELALRYFDLLAGNAT